MNEKTFFREAMGDAPVIRVLDFLIEGREFDYSLSDIAENSGVGRAALSRILESLVKIELVAFAGKTGKAGLFGLNRKSPAAGHLANFCDALLVQETEKLLSGKVNAQLSLKS